MTALTTRSGKELFPIGIGTWDMGGTWNAQTHLVEVSYENDAEIEALRYAISKGQNHIDSAELYGAGHTDEVIAQAIAGLKRRDLFIANKLWKTHLAAGTVRPAVEAMLHKLCTDYIDLLYIHHPWADAPWREAIPQIDELIDAGLVRHFGVSNFALADMQEAMGLAKHPLAANQMNYNVLYKDEVDDGFRDFCRQHNIALVAYRPIKRPAVAREATLQQIADAHNATPAQVALAWLLAQGTMPIPKSAQKPHIDENLAAAGLTLTDAELAALRKL